jgi:hypothetical protein
VDKFVFSFQNNTVLTINTHIIKYNYIATIQTLKQGNRGTTLKLISNKSVNYELKHKLNFCSRIHKYSINFYISVQNDSSHIWSIDYFRSCIFVQWILLAKNKISIS